MPVFTKKNLYYEPEEGSKLIDEYLEKRGEDEFCSLSLIDFDDFKQINISYGYQMGDQVLDRFLMALVQISSKDDILIRFGSDEFILFMVNTSVKDTNTRLNTLYSKLDELSVDLNVEVSCSIGVVGTDCAGSYADLYRNADRTLQNIKKYGKNNTAWYVEFSDDLTDILNEAEADASSDPAARKESTTIDGRDILSYAFEIFDRYDDIEDNLNKLIAKIGKRYNLDDIKLVFVNEESQTTSVDAAWFRTPELAAKNQKIEYISSEEDFGEFILCFNEEGIFTDKDISIPETRDYNQMIFTDYYLKHFLVRGIFENGIYKGAICYESDDPDYEFTDEIISDLKALSKIISMNMLKIKSDYANSAKINFLSKMSHDIRTPMNAIIGMTNIAMNVVDDKEKVLDCLKKIDSSSKYLLSLINDILDVSKIQNGKITIKEEPMNLLELVNEVVRLNKTQAEDEKINFTTDIVLKNEMIMGDPTKIRQVLMNLLSNAIKFTPEGGEVKLIVKQTLQEEDMIRVYFAVKDTGIGIKSSNLVKIFNAFEQADSAISNKYGGSGLGLSISSHLVRSMNGILKVESEEGKGSTFYFDVPFSIKMLVDPTQELETMETTVSENYDFTGKRVLLVEDNELNAEIARTLLEDVGFEVEEAENGKKAVLKYASMPPYYYDIILMDIRMPVMNGLEATNFIRAMGKEDSSTVPIYAMTANAFDDDMERSLQTGMNGHLSKPIDINKLYHTLKRQLFPDE
ncbi:MAG: response regulator [Lachnospiraceae bacterium]|nr:response regulator [Lachnospiraceae bacterium]